MNRRLFSFLLLGLNGLALKAKPVDRMVTLKLPARDMWWIYTALVSDSWHCRESGFPKCEEMNDKVIKEMKRQIPDLDD